MGGGTPSYHPILVGFFHYEPPAAARREAATRCGTDTSAGDGWFLGTGQPSVEALEALKSHGGGPKSFIELTQIIK